MTYTTKTPNKARVATYRQRVRVEGTMRDISCIRGPLEDARALMLTTVDGNPGAFLRYERVNYGLQEAYYEVVLPWRPSE